VNVVIVGADRITAQGDVANKIGTYGLAVLAKHHGIPFYVAAPSSTVDLSLQQGREIPIEERSADEVLFIQGKAIAPKGTKALHLGFDVTPHTLISAIVTERGVARAPYHLTLPELLGR
jgi:methylthioribose-1-phosphate isomerase